MFRDLGHQVGEARALHSLGPVHQALGDHPAAAASLSTALELYRDLGRRLGEPEVLNTTGELLLASSAPTDASLLRTSSHDRHRNHLSSPGSPATSREMVYEMTTP
jgi:hypothetical protein